MKTHLKIVAGSLAGVGIVTASALSAVSADTGSGNVGKSGIPRGVFSQERLDAVSQVLGTSTANIQNAHKDHTFKQLLKNAGLTPSEFASKVKNQLTSDLEAKGYSQSQVDEALQHKAAAHARHHEHEKKS